MVDKGIYQRGPYSYQVKMMVASHKISETFDTLEEARAFRDQKRVAKALDPDFKRVLEARVKKSEASSFTLTEALSRYEREVTKEKKGAYPEKCRIAKLKRYSISNVSFYCITPEDVLHFLNQLKGEGLSENSRRKYCSLISHCYNIAIKRWRLNVVNPVSSIELPSNGRPRKRRYEEGEEERFYKELAKARNPYVLPMVKFAVETAMRRGEILGLVWKDITYYEDGTGTGTAVLHDTKNGEQRIVPLSPQAVALLKALPQKERTRVVLLSARARTSENRIFLVAKENLRVARNAALKRARATYEKECLETGKTPDPDFLTNLRFHDTRREATSRLFESGKFDMMEVASITGHKTLAILKDYTHLRAQRLARKMG
jgi:integrase